MSEISDFISEKIYAELRDKIPPRVDYADGLPELDFSPAESDFLFYHVKHGPKKHYWVDAAAFELLQRVPFLDDDPGEIGEGFYADLIGDKLFPNAYQRSKNPLDCFLISPDYSNCLEDYCEADVCDCSIDNALETLQAACHCRAR